MKVGRSLRDLTNFAMSSFLVPILSLVFVTGTVTSQELCLTFLCFFMCYSATYHHISGLGE